MSDYVVLLRPLENFLQMPVSFYIVLGLLVLLAALLIALLAALLQHHARIRSYTKPLHDKTVEQAQKRAEDIVAKAMERARAIRVEAERKSLASLEHGEEDSREILSQYGEELKALVAETRDHLEGQSAAAEKRYQELLQAFTKELARDTDELIGEAKEARSRLTTALDQLAQQTKDARAEYREITDRLVAQSEEQVQQARKQLDTAINRLESQLGESIAHIQEQAKQTITRRVEEEFASMEEEVAAYRRARQSLVDNQMLALVEQVAEVALQKHLDLSEHADLVRGALKQAKQDGVFTASDSADDTQS